MVQFEWLIYPLYRTIVAKSIIFICVYLCISFFFSRKCNERILIRSWSISLLVIISFTLLFRYKFANVGLILQLGKSIQEIIIGNNLKALSEIIGNVLLFVPYGYCTKLLFSKKRFLQYGLLLTPVLIETLQLLIRIGFFELDDILMNSIGIFIGFGAVHLRKNE